MCRDLWWRSSAGLCCAPFAVDARMAVMSAAAFVPVVPELFRAVLRACNRHFISPQSSPSVKVQDCVLGQAPRSEHTSLALQDQHWIKPKPK